MWAIRWSAAIRIWRSLVPEDRVGGAVAGPVQRPRSVRSRKLELLAVVERPGHRRRASPSRGSCARRCAAPPSPPRGCRCAASARPRSGPRASASSSKLASRSAATPIAATSAPECSTTISTRPRWSMCWWVTIDQLEVVDRVAALAELALQLVERLARVGAGVDQGQRLVLDQVAVDPPDRERGRDRAGGGCRPAPPAPAPARASGVTPGSARGPRRAWPPCPRGRPATRG